MSEGIYTSIRLLSAGTILKIDDNYNNTIYFTTLRFHKKIKV